ncbi:Endonuclease/Exonuclease/phosphatase family protein [Roseivivax jejudonensis]|uniref:Endonuclease/Exonuclease/phosphatase family protein n=1 Tax=Roseivivax jejudonensis TaxID=1529041 RepID=A0A1X6Y6V6_9RHOB|nr:ExeM/NucH family extracellular endonuclease [Roseivivax jejudonensis]SLN12085.1 Endonuclease/Exonuclease/phosphatase family protein [Roseivivax jejudonensis]
MSLLITGIIDGPLTGGVPKAIELTALADIPDLSIYGIESANNGAPSSDPEFVLPSQPLSAGQTFYIASEVPGFTSFFGFAPDATGGAASINGDDAIVLFENGTIVDVFGELGTSGSGEPWEYTDGWAYRAPGATPTPTFDLAEWTFSGPDALDGETSNGTADSPFPAGSFVAGEPGFSIAAEDADKAEGDAGTTPFTFTVTRPIDTDSAATVDYAVTSAEADAADFGGALPSGTVSFAANKTSRTLTVDVSGDTDMEDDEAFTVSLSNPSRGSISVADATGRIVNDDLQTTLISEIQGNAATWGEQFGRTDATPLFGASVSVTAVVVGDFQNGDGDDGRNLGGFYLQEEDADQDGDPTTSEGIFVFEGSGPTALDLNVGDVVTVTGEATEFFGETQIQPTTIDVVDTGAPLPTPATISFPIANAITNGDGQLIADLEAYEGMLVTLDQQMTVADLFEYGRFGEIGLYADGRLETYTQSNAPDVDGFADYLDLAVRNTVTLNDGLSTQNPFSLPYPDGDYGTDDALRSGDTVSDILGVVRYSRSAGGSGDENYRINPIELPTFENTNPREEAPDVGGSLKVASFNVLNYFNGDGQGGGFPTSRGADTMAEFERQQEKLVAAITELDADVVGLIEIENDGYGPDSAIQSLVDALNAEAGAGTYAFVDPGVPQLGSDEIAVGFIYKPGEVALVGETAILDKSVDPRFDSDNQRPTLAQSFRDLDSGGIFTSAVNHFKSKGSPPDGQPEDDDQRDGAGNSDALRTNASEALADWLATDPTGVGDEDVLIIGDLNAYAAEAPISALREGADDMLGTDDDFTNLVEGEYSYGFPADLATAGQVQAFGTLDYALASQSLNSQVTGAEVWNINADEPAFIDYNTEFKPPNPDIYAPDAFRSSDHDPVVVGLDLAPEAPETVLARLEFEERFLRDAAIYSIDGDTISTDRVRFLSSEVELKRAGITISAEDGTFLPEFVNFIGDGLGVRSLRSDFFSFKNSGALNGRETLVLDLDEKNGAGDAFDVAFDFADKRGSGQLELAFYDDGALVEEALIDVSKRGASYDLDGDATFDRVEISTTGSLAVSFEAFEFERIDTDDLLV